MNLPPIDSPSKNTSKTGWGQIILTPLGCLIRSPLLFLLFAGILYFAIASIGGDLPWQTKPDFQSWRIDPAYETIQDQEGRHWEIRYESSGLTTFTGLVRHASPIRETQFPLLSHDILVTSGDFANPDIVRTSVANHRFAWYSPDAAFPDGSINLLHTFPENAEIFSLLSQIKKGQQVTITGREILDIRLLSEDDITRTSWADSGCNTLLVTSVEFQK